MIVGVYHNTVTGSYSLRDYYNDDNVYIKNNIFVGSTYALYDYRSDAILDYNLYHSTGSWIRVCIRRFFLLSISASSIASTGYYDECKFIGRRSTAGPTDLHVFGPLANDERQIAMLTASTVIHVLCQVLQR